MPALAASSLLRRRILLYSWTALLLLPVLYIAAEAAAASRNFPFWDEIDSAIDFLLKLHQGGNWHDVLQQFFTLNNEHRTVTSRIIFAISYWVSGTVNFHVIGLIGNLFIVGACALLVRTARTAEARIRMAVVLAFLVFQLEHYENFIWSGASIDHFQVILLAVAAIVALTRNTRSGLAWAAVFGVLATFTLAHGCLVWPLGMLWLTLQRAWRRLAGWSAVATVAVALFLFGFSFNPGHHIPGVSASAVEAIGLFWLQLVGSPLVLGNRELASMPGVLLVVLLGVLIVRRAHERHPVVVLTALFGVASLALVAFGRVNTSMETVTSRYMILSAVAWAMVIVALLEEAATEARPFRWLAALAPALIGLNITADVAFQGPKEAFIEVRDRAATYFKGHGVVGDGISRMYPQQKRADEVLGDAYQHGIYHLGRVSELVNFPTVEPSSRLITYVDEMVTNDRAVTIGGWAMLPGKTSHRGRVYIVLQSQDKFLVYSTLTIQRPDVAKAYHEPRWRLCGFRAVIGRDRVPKENFKVGVLIVEDAKPEYRLTDNQLALGSREPRNRQLASSQ